MHVSLLHSAWSRGVGTGPADLATAGPKFPLHQESLQFSNINYNQATSKFYFNPAVGIYSYSYLPAIVSWP